MGKKSSKKYSKDVNAKIILFVLIMIIMRIAVLNFMSDVTEIGFNELSRARIYNGNINSILFLESLVNFFGNSILESYKGIFLVGIINIFIASYIIKKKEFTNNFFFNFIIAYLFSSIITIFLILSGVIIFFAIIQCMVFVNSLKIEVSSQILWIVISILGGLLFIKYLNKSVIFSLLAFLVLSNYIVYSTDIGKKAVDVSVSKYSLEEFANNLNSLSK